MSCAVQRRGLVLCCGLAVVFTVFSYRLVHLQVAKHDEYALMAAETHVNKQTIYARRGSILDRHGEVLATNEPVRTVVADGYLMQERKKDPNRIATLIAGPLGLDRQQLAEKLRTNRRYVILKKEVPETQALQLEDELRMNDIRSVYFEHDSVRLYPNDTMLCHVLGFVDHAHRGVDGVERVMDSYLRGHDGFRFIERDRTGREIVLYRGQERPPRNGYSVRLTINMSLQNIVETELDAAVEKYNPKGAIVILMKPDTGEILALANRPNFDLSQGGNAPMASMRNRAILDMVEPGSTFKIVPAAAALNEHLVRPQTMIFCENGRFRFGGRWLRDHHPYADLSVTDILAKSSNIGAAKLALQVGDQSFYEYVRRFGFGERTGIPLPGEIGGLVHPPHRWSKISITRMPMGHEIGVTPMQMVAAMGVIANGGRLMTPQIIKEILDEDRSPIATYEPVEVRRVVSERTAEQVRDALVAVVGEQGTAKLASVPGYRVAGKTGTAQKPGPKGGYMDGKYVVSFVGFMPADKPEFVAIVMLDEAQTPAGQNYGGLVAAPIFARIAEKAARHLNLPPDLEEPGPVVLTRTEN